MSLLSVSPWSPKHQVFFCLLSIHLFNLISRLLTLVPVSNTQSWPSSWLRGPELSSFLSILFIRSLYFIPSLHLLLFFIPLRSGLERECESWKYRSKYIDWWRSRIGELTHCLGSFNNVGLDLMFRVRWKSRWSGSRRVRVYPYWGRKVNEFGRNWEEKSCGIVVKTTETTFLYRS